MEPIYVGDLLPSIASYKKIIEKYDKGIKAVSYTHLTLPTILRV